MGGSITTVAVAEPRNPIPSPPAVTDDFSLWLWVVIPLTFAAASAYIARNRSGGGASYAAFWGGLLLGPFGVALAFFAGDRCSRCQQKIHKYARVCRWCSAKIEPMAQPESAKATGMAGMPGYWFATMLVGGLAVAFLWSQC